MDPRPFISHRLLPTGHLQTMVGTLFGGAPQWSGTRYEKIPLPDGDELVLGIDWAPGDDGSKPLILLMHGLGGSGESSYIRRQCYLLNKHGFSVLRFNHRGCGPAALDQARHIYHSGRTADLAATLAYVQRAWPGRRCAVVGYSLSGNLLLRYLGTTAASSHPHLVQALAVCPAVDLERSSQALMRPSNWPIDRFFSFHVTRQALAHEARRAPEERRPLRHGLNLRQFDAAYTAPVAGFASRDEYYALSSAKDVLGHIELPTLILAAADDPIVPVASFAGLRLSAQTTLRIEDGGGHMGFISHEVTALGDRRWLDAQVLTWARSL